MAVVKINAIEVDPARGPELEQRFAQRAAEVESMPGFLGFELLRPTEGETRYFVYTRWETEEDFQAWVKSAEFRRGHARASADRGAEKPVAHGSSVLSFDVVLAVGAADAAARIPGEIA
jgi:heme-degrading monooxygenase HmoA